MLDKSLFAALELLSVISSIIVAYAAVFALYLYIRSNRRERSYKAQEIMEKFPFSEAPNFAKIEKYYDGLPINEKKYPDIESRYPLQSVIDHLNVLESISIGIRKGLYDEDVIRSHSRGHFLTCYKRALDLIQDSRRYSDNPSIYVNFEAISRRWQEGEYV